MKDKEDIDSKIDAALSSLDGLQQAAASPFLYTKVQLKLKEDRSAWSALGRFLSQPKVAISVCLILLLLNTWILLSAISSRVDESAEQLNDLALEYHFETPALPEQNPIQP
jgi:hypothetical protein